MFVGIIPLGNFGYFFGPCSSPEFLRNLPYLSEILRCRISFWGPGLFEFRALAEILCVVRICDSFEVDCRENWEFWGEFLVSVVCAGRLVWRPQRKLLFWNGMS